MRLVKKHFLFRFLMFPHQCVEIIAKQRAVVDDVPFEDNEEEEETQHHIAQVAEYVIECTVWDTTV